MASQAQHQKSWCAGLDLGLERLGDRTVLARSVHTGPLRVQKPFSQPDGSCHIYILHPPGGVVGGDRLQIDIKAAARTCSVFTSPSAGRFYRCDEHQADQSLITGIELGAGAHLEWIPQETIFYEGARASIASHVAMQASSTYLGWEVQSLGRRASGEKFCKGAFSQALTIACEDKLLHRERLVVDSKDFQHSPVGLNQAFVVGTLVAATATTTGSLEKQALADIARSLGTPNWGVTQKERLVLVRYLGESAEQCRDGFEHVRETLTDLELFNSIAQTRRPRIWNT